MSESENVKEFSIRHQLVDIEKYVTTLEIRPDMRKIYLGVEDDNAAKRCENCNVAPEDFADGHSFIETKHGIAYDVEHLNSLGHLQENGISLLFDRMNNRLVIERDELSLNEIIEELKRVVNDE